MRFDMEGFFNRIIRIDLSIEEYSIEQLNEDTLRSYLGGKGLATYFLYKYNLTKVNPLGPDNYLIFTTGSVTGGNVWGSCRYGVFTKSPLTGYYTESYSGGKTPEAISATGFDAILIKGKSNRPIVLSIDPNGAKFNNAGDLWGLDTYETEDAVVERYCNDKSEYSKSGAVVIGPAGENLIRFSVIENDYWRSAGRTGVGAVMGSKLVKAIVFSGDRKRHYYDLAAVKKIFKTKSIESKGNPGVAAYKDLGTPMMVKIMNDANAFPTRYWSEGNYEHWQKIGAEALHNKCNVKPNACLKCFMACGRLTSIKHGRHAGLTIEGPEYETIYAFGGLCMIDSIEEIAYLNDICDRQGMDTISSGNLCAFTIEASRRGKIDYEIDYGDVDKIAELLFKISQRQDIGDILSQGIKYASKKWDLEDIADHVKGLEPPGYDPRVL